MPIFMGIYLYERCEMDKPKLHIVSLSGGKDSTAANPDGSGHQ